MPISRVFPEPDVFCRSVSGRRSLILHLIHYSSVVIERHREEMTIDDHLEVDIVATFQRESLACFRGCRDLEAQLREEPSDLPDLVCVGLGEFPTTGD